MEQLDLIAEYAAACDTAELLAQAQSMDAAQAAADLYNAGDWVAEYLEVKPPPKKQHANSFRADSRNRFHGWLAWKLGDRPAPGNRTTYQLLDAADVQACLRQAQIGTERQARPLAWLIRNGFDDRTQDIWQAAVDLAGGDPANVTAAHTRQAVNTWKRDTLGTRGVRRALATSRAKRQRLKAEAAIRELINIGGPEAQSEYRILLQHIREMVEAKQPHLKAVN